MEVRIDGGVRCSQKQRHLQISDALEKRGLEPEDFWIGDELQEQENPGTKGRIGQLEAWMRRR